MTNIMLLSWTFDSAPLSVVI